MASLGAFNTNRLHFRPFVQGDLENLHQLYADPEVMKYVAPPRNLEQTRDRMAKHQADLATLGLGLFAAERRNDGVFVGRCGLDPVVTDSGLEGELAWMFFVPHWGQGYATEFGQRMIEIGLGELNLRRIVAHAKHGNVGSIQVMKKLGMRFVKEDDTGVEYEICAEPGE